MLVPGSKLGPYEIVAPLGAGGMGEVYRARDTRLGRDVAIKVLPESFASDPDRLRRFEQEARAVAALNHPNILAIHDVGECGGVHYLVSELLEGEPLRGKIAAGPLGTRRAAEYALQIAHGLAAAHEKGIVHRDLKPENIFVTRDGHVKILDFGLARQVAVGARAGVEATLTSPVQTAAGLVMGTASYMAPEQVRGHAADHRSDIFAFGAVLYEMLAGRRAFSRDTAAETMTAILKEDPPELAGTSPQAPPGLDRILRRCLEKEPEQRFQSAKDLAFALEAVGGATHTSGAALAVGRTQPKRSFAAIAVAMVAVVAVGAYFAGTRLKSGNLGPGPEFTPLTFKQQAIFQATYGPDGKTIVFSAALEGNQPEVFVLAPGYAEPRSLGLRDAHLLGVSPNNELALLVNAKFLGHRQFSGTLARMPLGSGAPREILENVHDGAWDVSGDEVAVVRRVAGRDRLEYRGKVLFETEGWISDPRFSRDGKAIAFFYHPDAANWDDRGYVSLVDLDGHVQRLSAENFWGLEGLAWSHDGNEVLFGAGQSYAAFTVYAVSRSGKQRVALRSAGGLFIYDVSPSGEFLVSNEDIRQVMRGMLAGDTTERDYSWLDLSQPISISHDGRMLVFMESSMSMGNTYAVAIRRIDAAGPIRIASGMAVELSPDAKYIAVNPLRQPAELWLYPTGPGEPRQVPITPLEKYQGAHWFPDGKRMAICGNEPGKPGRCYVLNLENHELRPFTNEPFAGAEVSDDGKLIVLVKGRGESPFVFVMPAEGGTPGAVTAVRPGEIPAGLSRDGTSIIVLDDQVPAHLTAVEWKTGRRTPIREIAPPSMAGVLNVNATLVGADGKAYAYAAWEQHSTLYQVRGVK